MVIILKLLYMMLTVIIVSIYNPYFSFLFLFRIIIYGLKCLKGTNLAHRPDDSPEIFSLPDAKLPKVGEPFDVFWCFSFF